MNRPDLIVVHVKSAQLRQITEHARTEVTDMIVVQNQLIKIV